MTGDERMTGDLQWATSDGQGVPDDEWRATGEECWATYDGRQKLIIINIIDTSQIVQKRRKKLTNTFKIVDLSGEMR